MPSFRLSCIALAAALLASAPAGAQSAADYDYDNLVFTGVGGHVALVLPHRTEAALAFNVRADLGLLGPGVRISPGLTYWSSSLRDSEVNRMERRIEQACQRGGTACPGIELGDVDISDLSFDLDGHYLWTTPFGVEPYAGAGVSLHLLNGGGEFVDDTFMEELLDAIAPGLNLVGGLEVPLAANLRVTGEARGVLTGTVRSLSFGVGGGWTLPADLRRPVMPPTVPPPPPSPPTTQGTH
ncbi:MAG TPA: hypothetical protein VF665_05435 [Longimicrobium sp.]|uniref:hypothetical protein n=1 Tax=Longimicrobium sp. TaxID=2029185 RepID=UPI002EDA676C